MPIYIVDDENFEDTIIGILAIEKIYLDRDLQNKKNWSIKIRVNKIMNSY